jgi:hypothetical protein
VRAHAGTEVALRRTLGASGLFTDPAAAALRTRYGIEEYLEIKYVCLGGLAADREPSGPHSAGDTGTNAP